MADSICKNFGSLEKCWDCPHQPSEFNEDLLLDFEGNLYIKKKV